MSIDLDTLFRDHAPALLAYVARRVPASAAEDVVSETFATAVRQSGSFDASRGTPRAWLFGIATNLLRHEWRSVERFARLAQRDAAAASVWDDATDGVPGRLDAERDVAALASALAALNEDDRDLLLLVAWGDLTPSAAASVLGIPGGTARSRLHRVRGVLKAELTRATTPPQIGARP